MAIVVSSVLWPLHEQATLRHAAATVADRLAAVLRAGPAAGAADLEDLRTQVDALRDTYARAPIRPAGPTQRDQALVRLLDQLQRAVSFAIRIDPDRVEQDDGGGAVVPHPPSAAGDGGQPVHDRDLLVAVAATLERTAAVLRGTVEPVLTASLEAVREQHRVTLEGWVAGALREGRGPETIAAQLSSTFMVRVLSHCSLSCEADAVLAVGGTLPPSDGHLALDTPAGGRGPRATLARAVALLRPHLRPDSVAFRNAARAATALAIALLVADAVHAEHGFWVVLGTLTVLKSSAMRTGITAVQALGGNLVGFAVAAGVLAVSGERPVALWLLLPVAVFLAAYAPSAVHFVVGQASFTVLVVVLFNLIEPEGWRTGLVRVESVAIGAAVSLVVGVVFWPRGNRQALRAATGAFYDAVATYLRSSFASTLAPGAGARLPASSDPAADADGPTSWIDLTAASQADHDAVRAAELRVDAALFDLLATPAAATVAVPAWIRLTSVGRSLRLAADGVAVLPTRGYPPLRDDQARSSVAARAGRRADEVAAVGAALTTGTLERVDGVDPPVSVLVGTDPDDAEAVDRALLLVFILEWMHVVDVLVELDDEPVGAVAELVGTPWWR